MMESDTTPKPPNSSIFNPFAPKSAGFKRGRRAKAAQDEDIVDKEDTNVSNPDLAQKLVSVKNNPDDESQNENRVSGWGVQVTKLSNGSRRKSSMDISDSIDGEITKKTIIGEITSAAVDNIPDMIDFDGLQVREKEFGSIAAAPAVRSYNVVKTIDQLENEVNQSSFSINQIQAASIPGLDLSVLISNSLCPFESVGEQDDKWEWDVVFTQVLI